jgi:hypothetical protein
MHTFACDGGSKSSNSDMTCSSSNTINAATVAAEKSSEV